MSRSRHISPLAIVLPKPSTARRASLRSSIPSPHTPRNVESPVFFSSVSKRTSTDSWNSSNGHGPEDELEWEWKQDQLAFLVRTLDALPAHLLTPFAGAVPPSNLLDKLAKGVTSAKGAIEWPHSLPATRAKLIELARDRNAENGQTRLPPQEDRRKAIEEEGTGIPRPVVGPPLQSSLNTRALCRQSSMDFLQGASLAMQTRSRSRLQRLNNASENSYHPYSRPSSRSPSPNGRFSRPVSYTGSYRSSGGSSLSSYSRLSPMPTRGFPLRRTVTESSASLGASVRRSLDSSSMHTDKLAGLKRAPSFSGLSTSSGRVSLHSMECFSGFDEEEKSIRKTKRVRTRSRSASPSGGEPSTALSATDSAMHSTSSGSTVRSTNTIVPRGKKDKKIPVPVPTVKGSTARPKAKRNPQRNPSMFGAELSVATQHSATLNHIRDFKPTSEATIVPGARLVALPPVALGPIMQPNAPRPLRRMKGLPIGAGQSPTKPRPTALRTPARRISFGSLKAADDNPSSSRGGNGKGFSLGSAFQMN